LSVKAILFYGGRGCREAARLQTIKFCAGSVQGLVMVIFALPKRAIMNKEIVVSGIRPTGFLHLGNYFGAMRNYVRMQEQYDCYFFVADWHSLTTHPDTKELRESVLRVLAENIAAGLDPEKVCLYVQSSIPEIAELYLFLNMMAYKGEHDGLQG